MENDKLSFETQNNRARLDRFDKDVENIFKEMKEISTLINKIENKISESKHHTDRQGDDIEALIIDVRALWDKYRLLEKDLLVIDNKLISNKGKLAFAERVFWILLTAAITVGLNYSNFAGV